MDKNVFFEYHPNSCFVKDHITKKVLLEGVADGCLHRFNLLKSTDLASKTAAPLSSAQSMSYFATSFSNKNEYNSHSSSFACSLSIWHERLGHPSLTTVTKILSSCNILFTSNKSSNFLCHACQLGKSHKPPFFSSNTVYSKPLALVVSDLWGPSPTPSQNGCKYYVTYVDAFSRFTWIYFLKAKSELYNSFQHFKAQTAST